MACLYKLLLRCVFSASCWPISSSKANVNLSGWSRLSTARGIPKPIRRCYAVSTMLRLHCPLEIENYMLGIGVGAPAIKNEGSNIRLFGSVRAYESRSSYTHMDPVIYFHGKKHVMGLKLLHHCTNVVRPELFLFPSPYFSTSLLSFHTRGQPNLFIPDEFPDHPYPAIMLW